MDQVTFKVNGVECSVGNEVSSCVTLLDYVREKLELRGTKYLCRQAGCGACIVSARRPNSQPYAINSCILPIIACHGLEITTIEEVGNRNKGYHPTQETLAKYNGSQCGYCSPGWIMSMYSLLQSKKNLTMLEIEQSLASNICRCTGYRSILSALKRFATDAPDKITVTDIEDLTNWKQNCKSCDKLCENENNDWCILSVKDFNNEILKINLKDGKTFYRATTVYDIFSVLNKEGCDSYKLICGNTSKGVYPNDDVFDNPRVLIDISDVHELKNHILDQNLILGAGNTLTEVLEKFEDISKEEYFSYLKILNDHIKLVAHIAVRNRGSIAGNLMIKHRHQEFQSDIFLLLETVGALLTVVNLNAVTQIVTMQKFLQLNMKGSIILNVLLPPLNSKYKLVTFKIMPRSQNAHAIVNAGFFYELNDRNIVQQARIVFGGLSAKFIRASETELFLIGKSLFTNENLQVALKVLESELIVESNPPEPSTAYRKKLALGLFFKGLLKLCPNEIIHPRFKSGLINLHDIRPVSEGSQVYDTDRNTWPLNQPIPKMEGLIQCAGEAMYTDDIPTFPKEVYAAFVLSTIGKGHISSIDATEALKYPGVITYYTAKDIPGLNSFTPIDDPVYSINEEVLCSGDVKYYNQPLALIVADTQSTADTATKLVKIQYTNIQNPVIDVKEAKLDPKRNMLYKEVKATDKGCDVNRVLTGGNTIYGQQHFSIETLVCVTKPIEEGIAVYATSQWLGAMQLMISRALKLDQSRIDVHVRRLGGSYGIKISRSIQTAVAASLVATKLNRPCRIIMNLETNTRSQGKRLPCSTDYEIGVNKSGAFQYVNYTIYEDNGYAVNENLTEFGSKVYHNCYNASTWNYKCYNTITDTAKNTWFRSPGTFENIAMVEMMMEQLSYTSSIDPAQLRLTNLDPQDIELKEMFETLKYNSEYTRRRTEVNNYNSQNRWKKRGIRFVFLKWQHIQPRYFDVSLSVFQGDGTVIISHGGVEIGQGINTKVSQIAAYMLKIPIEMIIVKENNTTVSPNSAVTGGSISTQNIIIAVERCCEELLARLEPIRRKLNNPTWEELIQNSFEMSLDLQVHGFVNKDDMQYYQVYGVTVAEVEIDVLTGEHEILRVDILQDVGKSINPDLDVGQVEGAFVMGIGYWTSEKLVYDKKTGELLTDRTWNYYVPQARDIPQDFRVYFRKNSYSNKILFGSKACSESPMCMAVSIPIAIREAIVSARQEVGIPSTEWFHIDGPYTTEEIYMACATRSEDFRLN
ncbi:unnamed protein product [Arctia plantaginis]|uniref:Aldehyde oxidase n=1 Tax=Arctia plantaginis TaxID=874455 RepID=A0A8S0Z7E6_ARCPL|nr:unnamed protein product [Arctia plantaginis]CAB3228212.1 unnamed protein product [Arctia plantaginis]